ncbi:ATP-dependent helicase [Desulfofustis glycolicus]|uniref:DNA 3'-5' helicase n=1 Tax=Desulfofustis glycolicus DSM 9705 TaxID=1121409 RepID=A0A1M5XXG1_9BACT|nr:ATP-dependent helicase [Desulfofustis glycolicus]MCB2215472.1 ATP-dependent helicase [Desulfobulbaceae bacterium]SHI04480.1 DNA helicase-2 / ATP-dependent DNA helicase PcrA [Desulfofustis glycolicus DSM 9705]
MNQLSSYRDELNESQFQAVSTTEGPVLVIAGAGSGKTRTLVYRVAHLINGGVEPEAILLLTFTRKAAQEMLWRAGRLLNDSCSRVTGGTFHSVANMLLRRFGAGIGFSSSFTIIDRADAEGIINLLKSSLQLTVNRKQFPSKRIIVNMLSGSVNKARPLEDLIFEDYAHLSEFAEDIILLQKHYHSFKIDHGLMDYDDLLVNWKRLLTQSPEAREQISARYRYIMVDEYQDTNPIQADIVRLAAYRHDNVMVVGDDSQSIYSFRGADFYNIMRFPETFPGTRIIKLEQNYRSTQPILTLTNDIINNAVEKYTKTLYTRIEGTRKPMLYAARDEKAEADFVVSRVRELRDEGVGLRDIAVLFRSGFHSFKLELELGSHGIGFEKRGGLKLTESAHMKDVLAVLRLLVNPFDNLSWNRLLLTIDKLGPKTAQKITAVLSDAADPVAALAAYPAGRSWQEGFARLVGLFQDLQRREPIPGELCGAVLVWYQPVFERLYADDYPKRQKDLEQLQTIIASYDDLRRFIDDTALDPPEADPQAYRDDGEALILSTIHSAKGLEWEVVFVIGLADGRFPHASAFPGEQWEEERRLLYVAATRARKQLYLSYPRELMGADRRFARVGMSPFLSELSPGSYERLEPRPADSNVFSFGARPSEPLPSPTKKKKLALKDFSVGCRVNHPFFGAGTVRKLSAPRSLDVAFDRHGLKTLHLDYATLNIVDG